MDKVLTLNGKTFNYPEQGEDPLWGEDSTAWAQEVTDTLNDLSSPGDILQTTFTVGNNTSGDVIGLLLDTGTVRSAVVNYSVYRISDTNPSGKAEEGEMHLVYDSSAGAGQKWLLSIEKTGNSGVTFNIDDDGQVTYVSSDIGSLGYSGSMRFRAKALNQ